MRSLFNTAQEEYLKSHVLATLATGREDGSPQVSLIAYHWDGTDIAIAAHSHSVKLKNILRQPNVALLIQDSNKQLIIYGIAEITDEEPVRSEAAERVVKSFTDDPESIANFIKQQRSAVLITPDKVISSHIGED